MNLEAVQMNDELGILENESGNVDIPGLFENSAITAVQLPHDLKEIRPRMFK